MIVLTADEADQVRGLTVLSHALAPVPLKDGTFVLPVDVLNDPFHATRHELLSQLPILRNDPRKGTRPSPDIPAVDSDYEQDKAILDANSYSVVWRPGEIVKTKPKE